MNDEYPYTAQVVAFSVTAFLAASALWLGLTAPDRYPGVSVWAGIAWLVGSALGVFEGLRKEWYLRLSFDRKPSFLLALAAIFFVVGLKLVLSADAAWLGKVHQGLSCLVLGVFCLDAAVVLRRASGRAVRPPSGGTME